MLIKQLKNLGFSTSEAKVYIQLLRMGASPASVLARRSGVKRVTVYASLNTLEEKGLVHFEQSGACRRYVPHTPELILNSLREERMALQFKLNLAHDCIEQLKLMAQKQPLSEPDVLFFAGEQAVREELHRSLDKTKSLWAFFINYGMQSAIAEFTHKFLKQGEWRALVLLVSAQHYRFAKQDFPKASCLQTALKGDPHQGDLIIQEDTAYFIFEKDQILHMLKLKQSQYSEFIQKLLLAPYVESST